MNSKRLIRALRWLGAGTGLAGIVIFYHLVFHANPTTVALTLLLLILFVAANWGLRYAIVTSVAATACYNFFFLPPIGAFTISDPQNVLALSVFLVTSVVASRMSNRIREESRQAKSRQGELEVLYRLSRALMQTDELVQLSNSIPTAVAMATGARAVLFYLLEGDRIYRSGADWSAAFGTAELKEISHGPAIMISFEAQESIVPLKSGVRPRGVLILRGVLLSQQSLEAVGGLVSISLDKAQAIEEVSRSEAAKESERLRDLMLDSITHELYEPLASIQASVSRLRDGGAQAEETKELLTEIDRESDRLNRLVAQAVEMAQLDTQEARMNLSSQDLGTMLQASVEACHGMLADHPLTVTLPKNLPKVEADAAWMEKLISNLLENAAKYSGAGQPIFVSAEVSGPTVLCSVADRGEGISAFEQGLIFDKFYRVRNRSQSTSGTGMGLSIARAIAEAHGGKITVTSQPGQGSVFTFGLRAA